MAELTILRLDFCDFCQCTFPDNVTNRRNHNEGAMHINNRKLHYDWYKGEYNLLLVLLRAGIETFEH